MRMRRKPWVRPELDACKFYVKNGAEFKGKWSEYFNEKRPIHMELGCGKGGFISKLASKNPEINYIVIDIKSEMLGLAKRNIEKEYKELGREIDNIAIMSQEIALIDNMLGENDKIERIYINFCNPWPRPKHNKKRLTHTRQLEKYKIFLRDGGEIYFKTDDDDLFKDSLKYFEMSGFDIIKMTYDLHEENDVNNIETEHEKMFMNQGIKIKALIAKKSTFLEK